MRKETILPVKSIAARVGLGTSKGADRNRHVWMQQTENRRFKERPEMLNNKCTNL